MIINQMIWVALIVIILLGSCQSTIAQNGPLIGLSNIATEPKFEGNKPYNAIYKEIEIDSVYKSKLNQGKWSYTFQIGWATNIDFALTSTSENFRFNGVNTGLNSSFKAYDSRENMGDFGGDQANNYLLTMKNECSGMTLTMGVIHDKREQVPYAFGNIFRYERGGASPSVMVGYQYDFRSFKTGRIGAQLKVGGYINIDRISVDLDNFKKNTTYTAVNKKRVFAGGGFVAMAVVSYRHKINNSWSVSIIANGTFMAGTAFTKVDSTHNLSKVKVKGKLSVDYSSISLGPSLGITYRRWRK